MTTEMGSQDSQGSKRESVGRMGARMWHSSGMGACRSLGVGGLYAADMHGPVCRGPLTRMRARTPAPYMR